MAQLSVKKRLFVDAFDGDNVYAMRVAGFTGADSYLNKQAEELLKDPLVIEAIRHRDDFRVKTSKAIADREERQALWTSIMRNSDPHRIEEKDENGVPKPLENIPLATRLKASELLGKSEADFVEKIDLNANVTVSDLIKQSYLEGDDDIDAIEAQYVNIKDRKRITEDVIVEEESSPGDPSINDFI